MKTETAPTFMLQIFLSGPKADIERECARYCLEVGFCVSVEPTRFIYTGGAEDGCVVRVLNYPRFPSDAVTLEAKATELAQRLLEATYQHSVLIVGPSLTTWLTKRAVAPHSRAGSE